MSSRRGSVKTKTGVPISALVVAIVGAVIFAIIAIAFFVQLQSCIKDARNNICPSPNDNTTT